MDWIEQYLETTEGTASPEIFRLWSAISAVAGALERRLWAETSIAKTYPNLYIMLVAPPGVGKTQAMLPAEKILKLQETLNIAPKSMTKAAVIDQLRDARNVTTVNGGSELIEYHALQIFVSELAVLVSSNDLEFLGVINEIFDNADEFRERRRHVNGGKEICIKNPMFNILVGAQPALLSTMLPEEAWGMGTTSRFIMIYADQSVKPPLFGQFINREEKFKELAKAMQPWTSLYGKFLWDDSAIPLMVKYYSEGLPPEPDSPKLIPYNTRRFQFLIKLAMISAVSRTSSIIIEAVDVERARHWLLQAERTMPNIFSAMSTKTDAQLLEEMHIFAWTRYKEKNFAPIPQSILTEFLSHRIYSERIPKVLEIAVKSGMLEDLGGGILRPLPRHDLGQDILKGVKK